jgi:hypothetical protein
MRTHLGVVDHLEVRSAQLNKHPARLALVCRQRLEALHSLRAAVHAEVVIARAQLAHARHQLRLPHLLGRPRHAVRVASIPSGGRPCPCPCPAPSPSARRGAETAEAQRHRGVRRGVLPRSGAAGSPAVHRRRRRRRGGVAEYLGCVDVRCQLAEALVRRPQQGVQAQRVAKVLNGLLGAPRAPADRAQQLQLGRRLDLDPGLRAAAAARRREGALGLGELAHLHATAREEDASPRQCPRACVPAPLLERVIGTLHLPVAEEAGRQQQRVRIGRCESAQPLRQEDRVGVVVRGKRSVDAPP